MAKKISYHTRRIIAVLLAIGAFCAYLILNPNSYEYEALLDPNLKKPAEIPLKAEQTKADSTKAIDVLENLAVQEKNTSERYYRKLFYDSWGIDEYGCNTRERILNRDLKNTVLKGCKVQSGILEDPYTGQTIEFVRGQDTSAAVQIDHVVALSNAWATGAYQLDAGTRYELSQDPLNLLAVEGQANQDKSDGAADTWLPSNQAFQCQYVARQISIKYKYHLWVTPAEKSAMQKVLALCPGETTVGLE
ncbi:MAG: HNH endonuclease family protein [Candidatus Saccharibacteria bacterium]|nr:HNH endonuclease family protein [Candidatus Saccharibacteria bacterium]